MGRERVGRARTWVLVSLVGGVVIGAGFGAFARWAMAVGAGHLGDAGTWRVWAWSWVIHLASGTWGWAVLDVAVVWALTSCDRMAGFRRWLWCWAVAAVFLTVVTAFWYDMSPSDVRSIGYAAALCTVVGAGTGFVSAFLTRRGATGLAARICLPLGLAAIILAGGARGMTAWVEGSLGFVVSALLIWWQDLRRRGRDGA